MAKFAEALGKVNVGWTSAPHVMLIIPRIVVDMLLGRTQLVD